MQLSYGEIVRIKNIAEKFQICDGEITHVIPIDSGRINSTYKIVVSREDDTTSYMLQKINVHVFNDVYAVMTNAVNITEHLRKKGKPTLEFIQVKSEYENNDRNCKELYFDGNDVYRMTKFIHAEVFQSITRPNDMQLLGMAVGDFAIGLGDFDASRLCTTIPDFHNTKVRFENLLLSSVNNLLKNENDRVRESQDELKFAIENKKLFGIIVDALIKGEIPLRVTHNDTKINNVLFDRKTNLPRCLIDLDTVMSGSILYDIADAIRSGANMSSEEETDKTKVRIDLELLKEFLIGFKKSAPDLLTAKEIELIPIAIKIIPFELGMRFLADYYDGDLYFGIVNKDDNLTRARVQFALVRSITDNMDKIEAIVAEIFR